jgi:molecular chaperone GrpE
MHRNVNFATLFNFLKRIFIMATNEQDTINQEELGQSNEKAPTQENGEQAKSTSEEDPQAKYNELNDRYLRLYSEFDNFRKRTSKEKLDLIKTAGEDIYKSLLPVIDDFERAIKATQNVQDDDPVKQGILLIYNKLKNTLTAKGLEAFESVGKPFDADQHEAITNIPAQSEDLKGKVVDEVEKGYLLNGKVIRYAKVIVGQ